MNVVIVKPPSQAVIRYPLSFIRYWSGSPRFYQDRPYQKTCHPGIDVVFFDFET